jgi:multiple antibiotic resistance protein
MTLFVATFTTLLAIINPLEALPVLLGLSGDMDVKARRRLARRACVYALLLMFFFLIFGTLMLHLFGVSLSMVRIAGGIILTRIGFALFSSPASIEQPPPGPATAPGTTSDVAFVPLAMPIMFGPGAMATIISMSSEVKDSDNHFLAYGELSAALVATMAATFLVLASAKRLQTRLGPKGIDAATRIIGFFVASMGIGMAFDGAVEALKTVGFAFGH